MNLKAWKQFFKDTDYVHRSGTPEELRAAEYLKARCEALGVPARLEAFPVPMGEIEEARVLADGKEIPISTSSPIRRKASLLKRWIRSCKTPERSIRADGASAPASD